MLRLSRYLIPAALLLFAVEANARSWAGFYDRKTLVYWQGQTPPGIEENFREVVWPMLTPEEKRRLAGVVLEFPLEDSRSPMSFFSLAEGSKRTVTMPISSLRFFGDIAVAYAWLNESGYSTDPVTDYLAMLKYQWPEDLAGHPYLPRDSLGIPADATANPRVDRRFQQIYGTAIVFVLGHELGHLYYRHPMDVSPETSRHQEEEADSFAMEVMRRIGAAPVGMVPFFSTLAYLEPYKTDPNYLASLKIATHPITSSRLIAIADGLQAHAADFSRTGTHQATIVNIASEIRKLAANFDDPGVQDLIRQKGLTAKAELLGPRKPGESVAAASPASGKASLPFSGNYAGKWLNDKGTDFDVQMALTRRGDAVHGSYNFGVGNVAIEGTVSNDSLFYNWKWGTDYFGKGVLKLNDSGRKLIGTWGYTHAESGAGTWKLYRAD